MKRFQAAIILPLFSGTAIADVPGGDSSAEAAIEELVVYGRSQLLIGTARSASEGIVGYDDIALPPLLRVGELVEAVPGMVATQHSGTGKANQYFIRGFNLDHGTDFSASAGDVPLNMRSHGHGQGYLDLNFIIPELVATTSYRRGPYFADTGDFSSAASVSFDFYDELPGNILAATVGENAYHRALAAGSIAAGDGIFTGALDVTGYDGPWVLEENLGQYKFYTSWASDLGEGRLRLGLQGYDSTWDSTDQIPQRAVESGAISRLGYIDPHLGGRTQRFAATAAAEFDAFTASVYAIDYDFALWSNFTYFLNDPVSGDEFEQRDRRRVYGGRLAGTTRHQLGAREIDVQWGGELRLDDIDEVGLYATEARVRRDVLRRDAVQELSVSAWLQAEMSVLDPLRATFGLRADRYGWDVNAFRSANSGSGNDVIVSPSAGLAYRLNEHLEAYVNAGRGFHSNDVRGVTIRIDPASGAAVDRVDALVASRGTELGLRFERDERFNASLVLFRLDLDSELTFVGDAGTTEPNAATRRHGLEATVFWQAADWLAVNAAWAATDAGFKVDQGGGSEIPGAVESTFTLGLNGAWSNGWRASTRLRWLGEAPLVEDGSIRSGASLLVNAGLQYRTGSLEYRLDIFNLLDSGDDDIAYLYASRLPGEPASGIEDIHFHPLEPRTLRGSVTWSWH